MGISTGSSLMNEPGRGRADELDEAVPFSSVPELQEGDAPKSKRCLGPFSI
jgi:hypothetical protein